MFDFYISRRLVRGRNVYHGVERRSKRGGGGRGEGAGQRILRLPEVILGLGNCVRPQTELLIGAV